MSQDSQAQTIHCPICDEQTKIEETVPWQDDICTNCRNSIPGSASQ